MTLMELKEHITKKRVPTDFMIFVAKDNKFLASQYIKELCRLAGSYNKISSIYEPQQSSLALLTATENTLNVMTADTFDERAENYSQFENTIVICDQVDKSIATVVVDFIIKFPKLEEWQIFDYAKMLCPHVDNEDLLWLVKATDNNIERVSNELEKVALFTGNDQKAVFSAIRFDAQTDLYKADSLMLTDALAKGDAKVLFDFLKHSSVVDIDPVALANGTLTKLKDIILVSQNLDLTAEDCGISTKYFNYIRRNYYNLNINVVKHKIKFLANFDLALKTSKLDMSKHDMLNYLINNLMYKIT
jgi:DNA polymerase III delta subunit